MQDCMPCVKLIENIRIRVGLRDFHIIRLLMLFCEGYFSSNPIFNPSVMCYWIIEHHRHTSNQRKQRPMVIYRSSKTNEHFSNEIRWIWKYKDGV